jgi:hypothetical protein
MKLYIETYRPPFPEKGVRFRVHKEKGFSRDVLSPNMTAVVEVDNVTTKDEAIAVAIERLAGHNTTARVIFGGGTKK